MRGESSDGVTFWAQRLIEPCVPNGVWMLNLFNAVAHPQVCSEELQEGVRVTWLQCSHVFHERCIRQWLTGFSATCPTCRAAVAVSSPHHAPVSPITSPSAAGPINVQGTSATDDDGRPSDAATLGSGDQVAAAAPMTLPSLSVPSTISTNRIVSSILAELCATLTLPPPSLTSPTVPTTSLRAAAASERTGGEEGQTTPVTDRPALARSASGPSEEEGATVDIPGVVPERGISAANSLEDSTYCELQRMYRRNFGRRSQAAESVLAGWMAMKEGQRRSRGQQRPGGGDREEEGDQEAAGKPKRDSTTQGSSAAAAAPAAAAPTQSNTFSNAVSAAAARARVGFEEAPGDRLRAEIEAILHAEEEEDESDSAGNNDETQRQDVAPRQPSTASMPKGVEAIMPSVAASGQQQQPASTQPRLPQSKEPSMPSRPVGRDLLVSAAAPATSTRVSGAQDIFQIVSQVIASRRGAVVGEAENSHACVDHEAAGRQSAAAGMPEVRTRLIDRLGTRNDSRDSERRGSMLRFGGDDSSLDRDDDDPWDIPLKSAGMPYL